MARDAQIQVRRDTAANWTSTNPTLAAGEPGFETDTGLLKIGDGSTAWTSLRYVEAKSSDLLAYQPTSGIDIVSRLFVNSASPGNGNLRLTLFTPLRAVTVSNFNIWCQTGAADTGGTTVRKLGLFTVNSGASTVTCVARSANDTALLTTTSTLYTKAFTVEAGYSSSYTLLPGTTYAVGSLCYNTGGTFGNPTYGAVSNILGSQLSLLSPPMVLSAGSQTDITNAAVGYGLGSGNGPWMRLS